MSEPSAGIACSCRCSVAHPGAVCTGVANVSMIRVSFDQSFMTEKICEACCRASEKVKKDKWDRAQELRMT